MKTANKVRPAKTRSMMACVHPPSYAEKRFQQACNAPKLPHWFTSHGAWLSSCRRVGAGHDRTKVGASHIPSQPREGWLPQCFMQLPVDSTSKETSSIGDNFDYPETREPLSQEPVSKTLHLHVTRKGSEDFLINLRCLKAKTFVFYSGEETVVTCPNQLHVYVFFMFPVLTRWL